VAGDLRELLFQLRCCGAQFTGRDLGESQEGFNNIQHKVLIPNRAVIRDIQMPLQPSESFRVQGDHLVSCEKVEIIRWGVRIILQEYNDTTPFPRNEVIKSKPRHLTSFGLYKCHERLFLFVRNCQAFERYRRPLDVFDISDSKLRCALKN
jgi:hypothetical protein